jgi:two-component system LytT family response regulator
LDSANFDTIRTAIVTGDEIACAALQRMLATLPDVAVCGTCPDADAGVALIREQHPDLVFAEVELRGGDAFAMLRTLAASAPPPPVVFVGAHDGYVAEAIEAAAVDYLIKPVQMARLERALDHYRARRDRAGAGEMGGRLRGEVVTEDGRPAAGNGHGLSPGRPYIERLLVKSGDKRLFLRVKDIDRIVTRGNYLCLQAGASSFMMRGTLNEIEGLLDPSQFLRVHRAAMVNVDRIQEFSPWFNGEYLVVLKDGTQLKMSRGCRDRLFKRKAL